MMNNIVNNVWQICPKCSGQGKVKKPLDVYGDMNNWNYSSPRSYKCNVCNGKMIISILTGLPPVDNNTKSETV